MKSSLKPVFAALVLMLSLATPAAAGSLEDAAAADDKGDYATAAKLLRPLADEGNAQAQYKLGILYDDGLGVAQDVAEALKWYRLAADQGFASRQGFTWQNDLPNLPLPGTTASDTVPIAALQGYGALSSRSGGLDITV